MPHRRDAKGRILFHTHHAGTLGEEWEAPEGLDGLIDVNDPDLDYIINAIVLMREAGVDMTTADAIKAAIAAGRRKAKEAHEALHSEHAIKLRSLVREDNERREENPPGDPPCVYYARLGNRIKIGYTLNLHQRMAVFQPEEVMATEPGGITVEAKRHEQFARLRVSGEWFRYEDELVEHVEELRRKAAS